MIQWIIISLLFIFNLIFLNMKHPLAMGLVLLIQTTLMCLMSGLMTTSFWFSYILFLIFIGGMLVLFIYVTSLASNEMLSLSIKLMLIYLLTLLLVMMFFFIMDKNMLMNYQNMETKSIINLNTFIMETSLSLNKLYNFPTNLMTILLMNYLLITLIAVVKITKLFKGPMRQMLN
uniref:NADH-ubiquinone oxidoreductase chain 6 n=1 Tax=Morinia doronici TaxID=1606798 RepID=A0A7G7CCY4_9MUSC|nr:NADH dehydrogenase subunit 6 [Morinia doronici]